MECVSTQHHPADPADRIARRNECNTVIIATCIPTLRPLFLIIFRRPGRKSYQRRQIYSPDINSRIRNKQIRGTSNPLSDSTTAIGHDDKDISWIELGPGPDEAHNEGEILRTLEFDGTARKEGGANYSEESMNAPRR